MMLSRIKNVLRSQEGISDLIGVAFLLIFVVFGLGKPLADLGSTMGGGFNKLNNKLNQNLQYIDQIPTPSSTN